MPIPLRSRDASLAECAVSFGANTVHQAQLRALCWALSGRECFSSGGDSLPVYRAPWRIGNRVDKRGGARAPIYVGRLSRGTTRYLARRTTSVSSTADCERALAAQAWVHGDRVLRPALAGATPALCATSTPLAGGQCGAGRRVSPTGRTNGMALTGRRTPGGGTKPHGPLAALIGSLIEENTFSSWC